ncbi:DUF4920 domain-containing protein [bacterium]|nr:DUF4920 domain-containing protein [bacterium]
MKRTLWAMLALSAMLLAGCGGSDDQAKAQPESGWSGGAEMTIAEATALAELGNKPAEFVGKTMRLEGEVVAVCQGTGCWVELSDEAGNKFYARSMDESILFPTDCTGKKAVVQGTVIAIPPAGHDDHEEGSEEGDHYCPEPTYMLSIEAAKLL